MINLYFMLTVWEKLDICLAWYNGRILCNRASAECSHSDYFFCRKSVDSKVNYYFIVRKRKSIKTSCSALKNGYNTWDNCKRAYRFSALLRPENGINVFLGMLPLGFFPNYIRNKVENLLENYFLHTGTSRCAMT
jgi:hypothetical protein